MNTNEKGRILERFVERGLLAIGIQAFRHGRGLDQGRDVIAWIGGEARSIQCKNHKDGSGYRFLYETLDNVDLAVLRADRKGELVVLRWDFFILLLKAALWRQSQPPRAGNGGFSGTEANSTTCDVQETT